MDEKGLGRESDDVIVGVTAEGLKQFIVQIATYKNTTLVRNPMNEKSRNVTEGYHLYREVRCVEIL